VIEEFKPAEYRIGLGTDIHRIVEGRRLMLGGVYIPYPAGLLGHSDGDVALHALTDALLGAVGMGDIGTHFPDTDARWKDADSKGFLYAVKEELDKRQWEVVNVDLTITTEAPKLGPVKGQIRRCIAGLLGMDFASVNVKAKTNEGLGEIGAGEAMSATAIALLRKKPRRTL
jgi:2-C-methyl-D-erythritol 2,4-cyclodiphosphate synthase